MEMDDPNFRQKFEDLTLKSFTVGERNKLMAELAAEREARQMAERMANLTGEEVARQVDRALAAERERDIAKTLDRSAEELMKYAAHRANDAERRANEAERRVAELEQLVKGYQAIATSRADVIAHLEQDNARLRAGVVALRDGIRGQFVTAMLLDHLDALLAPAPPRGNAEGPAERDAYGEPR